MCGIIAILRRRSSRPLPEAADILACVAAAEVSLDASDGALVERLEVVARALCEANTQLSGSAGVAALTTRPELAGELDVRCARLTSQLAELEASLETNAAGRTPAELEIIAAAMISAKDAVWAVARDRLRTAREVLSLTGSAPQGGAVVGYLAIQEALSALDRLEVRGRDSAGLQVLVHGHGLDLADPAVASVLAARRDDLFGPGTVEAASGCLSFVYKAAAEIGELGDNSRVIRAAIAGDDLLRRALNGVDAEAVVMGHTRWASVGIISGPNAHPLNAVEIDSEPGPYVTAALNGDVDNFADLKASYGLRIRPEITTDAKVIPTLTSRALVDGMALREAFRRTVAQLEGSVAISAQAADHPTTVALALRGSGQALYVGFGEDLYVVASEPYGLVEIADRYLRMDGETPSDPTNPTGSRGQVVLLDAARAGEADAVSRWSYDGAELPVRGAELVTPQITTRDIDRGAFPHFLLKEISESPGSFRKTLRGKLVGEPGASVGPARRGVATRLGAGAPGVGGHQPGAGDRPGDRGGGRPGAGAGFVGNDRCRSPAGAGAARDRAVRVRAALGHGGHAGGGDLPVGDHDGHQPHRGPGPVPGGGGHLDRQPAPERPGRQIRRRALHLRRPRRGDVGGVDQGVLLPDRGRIPARHRHRRGGRPVPRRLGCGPGPAGLAAGAARQAGTDPGAATADRGRGPPVCAVAPLLGVWWATDPIASPRTRCGSSCPSFATSPSPATSPRTRSTSICRPSR